jgi:hypothetical protein
VGGSVRERWICFEVDTHAGELEELSEGPGKQICGGHEVSDRLKVIQGAISLEMCKKSPALKGGERQ